MKTKQLLFTLVITGASFSVPLNTIIASDLGTLQSDSIVTTESELSFEDQALIELFQNHIKRENYEWALTLWNEIEVKNTPELQYAYLTALEATGKRDSSYYKHEEFLKKYPNYGPALFWKAKYHFDKAERKYQSEMAKYNKDKNTTAYAYLRRELKKLTDDYKISRDILLKLKEQDPTNKNQLVYLRNCYIRLEMQDEAAKVTKIIDQL